MQPDANREKEQRVLLVPPTRRDGEVTSALLARAGLGCLICRDLEILSEEISAGAGAVLLTEETLAASGIERLLASLQNQPSWSQLPVVLLIDGAGRAPVVVQAIQALGNTTLLDRPAPTRSVISALEVAVKGRERQYQIRDQFEKIRRAEARARELQQQLAIAVNASELGTFHSMTPFNDMIWNDRCKAHFWLGPDAKVDFELFYSVLHPEDRERVRRAVEECIYGGKLYDIEFRTVSPDGETRWIRATGRTYCNSASEPIRFDGTTQDISERKAVETAFQETRERFEAMANSIPQLAWMAKPDGWIFWYNQRWHDYCGTTAERMEGWGWQAVHDLQELPRVLKKWQNCVANGEPWEDSFPLRRFDGELRWHLSRAMPFRDPSGNIVFWFGTNTDITDERTRSEERRLLLESERAARLEAERIGRMKDEFLATLSHELRTPLNAIFGWTQILRMGTVDPETRDAGIAVIDRNVRIQTQLIEDLLDMSRIISGKIRLDVQTVELSEVLHATLEAIRPAAEAKQIRLERIIDPLAGPVSGDPSRLQQVFWNLLTNAIKFTPKGQKIQVVAERVDSHVQISVSDTGEGILPEFLPRLFDRFSQADGSTTRKHGGLGLGLSIVKNLVELHGGTVHARSAG